MIGAAGLLGIVEPLLMVPYLVSVTMSAVLSIKEVLA